jgi:hypothetical protein
VLAARGLRVAAGERGNLVGSYKSTGTPFLAVYGNWRF